MGLVDRRIRCLDPDRKLIAYRFDQKMHYFLQWKHAGRRDSHWKLLHSNQDNSLELVASGEGMERYVDYLGQAGIDSEEVLWGRVDL